MSAFRGALCKSTKYLGARRLLTRAKTGSAGLCLSNMNASTACCTRNTAYTNPFSLHMTPTLIITRIRSKAVPWDYLISGPVTSLSTLFCEVLMKHDSAASKHQYKTMYVIVFIGLFTTTVSPATCMETILNSSSPETIWTLRWDEKRKSSTITLLASIGSK